MTDRIGQLWASFDRNVIPATAGAVQRQEMRRAFYAGAQAFLGMVLRQVSAGDDVNDDDEAMMEEVTAELEAFADAVLEGRA